MVPATRVIQIPNKLQSWRTAKGELGIPWYQELTLYKFQLNNKAGGPAKEEHGIPWCQKHSLKKFQLKNKAGGPAKGEHGIPCSQEIALYIFKLSTLLEDPLKEITAFHGARNSRYINTS